MVEVLKSWTNGFLLLAPEEPLELLSRFNFKILCKLLVCVVPSSYLSSFRIGASTDYDKNLSILFFFPKSIMFLD